MKSLISKFHNGFKKTASSFSKVVTSCFSDTEQIVTETTYDTLESALIQSDFGIAVSTDIVNEIRKKNRGRNISGKELLNDAKKEIAAIFKDNLEFKSDSKNLRVILLVGVNGCGKTTTAGKLANILNKDGKKVMLAACDTFRAAAVEQLNLWGERVGSNVISSFSGADPSSVAYDAVQSALAKKADFLIIDTAGRQHTKSGLMDELSKLKRTISKLHPEAPQDVWLVVDGSIGSNALLQAREFTKSCGVNGIVCSKLDGSYKGGMVTAIKREFGIPIFFIGLGEQADDLQPFNSQMYIDSIFEDII